MYSVCSMLNSLIIYTSAEANGNLTCSSQHPDLPLIGHHFVYSKKMWADQAASKFICSNVLICV